jgi:hypothetical protein
MKYVLVNTFSGNDMSSHRSLEAAVRAEVKNAKYWRKNGRGSYIPTEIKVSEKGVTRPLNESEKQDAAEIENRIR